MSVDFSSLLDIFLVCFLDKYFVILFSRFFGGTCLMSGVCTLRQPDSKELLFLLILFIKTQASLPLTHLQVVGSLLDYPNVMVVQHVGTVYVGVWS